MENIGGMQVGHVPRDKASRLAPLIDRGVITVEGVMHEGNRKCGNAVKLAMPFISASIVTGFSYALSM